MYSGDKKACDNVSINVESGDIFGFIGHNGAGKSTTIRAVVGVLDFTDGEITIDGHSVKTEPMECKKITAYIPFRDYRCSWRFDFILFSRNEAEGGYYWRTYP